MQQQTYLAAHEASDAKLAGAVHRVTYHNPENDYAVLRLRPDEGAIVPTGARNQEGLVTLTGYFPAIKEGLALQCAGRWVEHERYGLQFDCADYQAQLPGDINGTKVYLQQVKGIGPATAERIIRHFGAGKLAHILRREPQLLLKTPQVKQELLEQLVEYLRATGDSREALEFLYSQGISPAIARRIYRAYGKETVARLQANPYMLAQEVYGIGFLRADQIAQRMGVPEQSPYRIRANLSHQLERAAQEGHTYLPADLLCQRAQEQLAAVDPRAVAAELEEALKKGDLRAENLPAESMPSEGRNDGQQAIYLPAFYEAEKACARRLRQLLRVDSELRQKMSADEWRAALQELTARRRAPLSAGQRAAIDSFYQHKVSILTGGPGTGKTETLRSLIAILREGDDLKFALAAPTGRAAKRMNEATGANAKTIHRLLGFGFDQGRWRPAFHEDNPLPAAVVVIDEASMLDLQLFAHLLKAMKNEAHLLLLGDIDQLPSVGAGRVLRDCLEAGQIAVTRLKEIFRQEADSAIVTNAHRVVNGRMPHFARRYRDFFLFQARDAARAAELLVEVVCERIPREFPQYNALRDIQVMAPMREGVVGVRNFNRLLQERLNPPGAPELRLGEAVYRAGDRLMQTRNNYDKEVYNGDIGFLKRVDEKKRQLVLQFDQRLVEYKPEEAEQLTPAYCITIHKSQGSEYPVVVIALLMQHYVLLQRNLLYTAITRAREKVVIVGNQAAIGRAVSNNLIAERYSGLQARLQGNYPPRLGGRNRRRKSGRRLQDILRESGR